MEEIIKSILSGRCILFTGADFSQQKRENGKQGSQEEDKDQLTVNLLCSEFLRGGELAKDMLTQCSEMESDNLEYASEIFIEKKGKYELINYLQNQFKCKKYSSLHENYANLPWKNIYTTNYDNILEKANPLLRPLTIKSSLKMSTYEKPFVLHINGYIDALTEDSLDYDFKLTKTSYLVDAFNDSEWKKIFESDIKVCDYIIFIGYSLNDFDIEKILFPDEYLHQKIIFITSERVDKERDHRLKKFGQIFNIGKEALLKDIQSIQKKFKPIKEDIRFSSFNVRDNFTFSKKDITDKDIFNLLMYGKSDDDLICKSIINHKKCCVASKSIESILSSLDENNIVSLSAEMGNGKTIMTEMIKCFAIKNKYKVYSFLERTMTFEKEVDLISKCKEKHIVIVENYHNKIDMLQELKLKLNSNARILLTERTVFNDLFYLKIEEIFGNEIINYDLNFMPDDELKMLIDIFEVYGFAGAIKTKGSLGKQIDYLKDNLKRSMFLILLDLMSSKVMKEKSQELFIELKSNLLKKPQAYEAFIALLILSVIGRVYHNLDFYDLLGNDVRLQSDFFRDSYIKQIVSNDSGYISIKSSVLSNYILQNFIEDTGLIVKIILRIINNALKQKTHEELARELVNFSVLERILTKDKREELVYFYENLKEERYFSSSPHFWLQYAIAMISISEFPRAEQYFTTAYSISARRGWTDTSKLDNHYARFLLDKNIRGNDNESYLEDFKGAHERLKSQISEKSNYFFPFKVASNYASFYNKFRDKIENETDYNVRYIQDAVSYVIEVIESLPESGLRNHYFVKDCINKLLKVQKIWMT